MSNIQQTAGNYYLERVKRLRRVPPDQAGSAPIRMLIDNLLNSRANAQLTLQPQQGNMGLYLGGRIDCLNNTQQFRIYANKLTPNYDLEGVIYAYNDEIVFVATTDERQINMDIYAEGPNGQNGFYTYKFIWIKRLLSQNYNSSAPPLVVEQIPPQTMGSKYSLDVKAIGHWRFSEYISSGGFSYYREINMVLAQNGRFVRTSQSFASGAHRNQYGDWLGMTTAHNLPADERGDWGIVNERLYLYFDDDTYMDCSYHISEQGMLCYYASGRQYWEKIN